MIGNVEEVIEEEEEGDTGRLECRSKCWANGGRGDRVKGTGHQECRSKCWGCKGRCDELSKPRDVVRDGFSKSHEDQRDEFSKIHNEQCEGCWENGTGPEDDFAQWSKRKTRRGLDRMSDTTKAGSVDDVLEVGEVNEVVVVQEMVEITVDPGAAKSVWLLQQKGVARTKAKKTVRLAAASGSPMHVDGDAILEFVRTSKDRWLRERSGTVDEGNIVVFGKQDSYIKHRSTGQRIPMRRWRNGVHVVWLDGVRF